MTKENGTATMNGNGHAEPTKTSPTGIKMSKEGMTGPLNTTHHVSSREERERKREREREAAWTSQPFVLLSLSHKRRTHIGNATFSLFSLSFVPSSLFPFVEKRREERGRESDRKRREILAFGNFLFSPSSLSNSSASFFFSSSSSFSFFFLSLVSLAVEELLLWEDPIKSGGILGGATVAYLLFHCSGYSALYIVCNLLLVGVIGTFVWSIIAQVC